MRAKRNYGGAVFCLDFTSIVALEFQGRLNAELSLAGTYATITLSNSEGR